MALDKEALKTNLSKFMDPDSEGFEGSPANTEEFAEKFSKAISDYVKTIAPPMVPGTLTAATATLKTALLGVGTLPNQLFPVVATAAMAVFSGAIALGMSSIPPQGSVVAAPPPPANLLGASISIRVLPLGLAKQPASACIEELAATIDDWFRTGTANGNPWS